MQGHNIRAPIPTPRSMLGPGHEEHVSELRRGPWTLEEDNTLSHYISSHGEGRWNMLAKFAGLKRTGKSCRLRWLNYLKPDIKRGKFTPQEQILILELHSKLGNRWSKIARNLPGRTDNEIKNYWRTRVKRQARQLNIEPSSKRFLEAIRCFWAHSSTEQPHSSSSISDTTMNPLDDSVSAQPRTDPYTPPRHQQQQAMFNESVTSLGFESFDCTTYSETLKHGQVGATSSSECQVAEPDWLIDNMGDCMWDMDDEMWQLDI